MGNHATADLHRHPEGKLQGPERSALPRILTKIKDQEDKWIVHVELSATESIALVCADDPVDEEAFFQELRDYLAQSPDLMTFFTEEPDYTEEEF